MSILRFLATTLALFLVLAAGSVLAARLHQHQRARDLATALDRPEARAALQKQWPLR